MPMLAPIAAVTLDAMRHHRRVLVASAPAGDPRLAEQRALFDGWAGAADRDVTLVTIAGDAVTGATDAAADLRRRFHLPAGRFAVALVGKDGHVALHADHPLAGAALQAMIDAMPMRRAGLR